MVKITKELRAHTRERAGRRCECRGSNCRHHLSGARCKRGLRGDEWKVYWRTESGGSSPDNIEAWCLDCFENNFTVPTSTVTILRSDIVGYAILADEDRRRAVTLLSVLRDAAEVVANDKQGRLLETEGEDVGLEFAKSRLAVDAARELQPRFHEWASRLNLPTPELCHGIHRGEVTRSRAGAVYGDAIEIASRVRRIADPGRIVVSESVADELGRAVELEDLGSRDVDELDEPLRCWVVLL